MTRDFFDYNSVFTENRIVLVYGGPLWADAVYSMADILRKYLDLKGQPANATQSIFAVFVEQLNNMMMHSAEKECIVQVGGSYSELPKGSFVLGINEGNYYLQTGNIVTKKNSEVLKERIDYLNSLEKKELIDSYKEKVKEKFGSSDRSAGAGLIEIAWRAKSKIKYEFTHHADDLLHFTMYVTI